MSQFEYIIVFLSILVALAVAELLAGLGRIIRHRTTVRIYWVHIAWMVIMIIAIMQGWWSIWATRDVSFESFDQFLFFIIPRLGTVLVAFLLSPPISNGEVFDLREYYFRQIGWIAWLFAGMLLLIGGTQVVFGIDELVSSITAVRVLVIAALIVLGMSKNHLVHAFSAGIVGTALIAATFIEYSVR